MNVFYVIGRAHGKPLAKDEAMFGRGDLKIKEFTKLSNMKSRIDKTREAVGRIPDNDDPSGVSRPLDASDAPAPKPRGLHEGHVLIGEGVKIVGEIRDCRKLEIHGTVEGDLEAEELIVHENGLLKGSIKTDRAEVNGTIDGDISVTHLLDLKSKGSVAGTTQYGEISVETGGRIVGKVDDRADRNGRPARPADAIGAESVMDYGFRGFTTGLVRS
jgi:cytoskeletal protein CcmA (bactofilin family)